MKYFKLLLAILLFSLVFLILSTRYHQLVGSTTVFIKDGQCVAVDNVYADYNCRNFPIFHQTVEVYQQ